MTSPRFTRYALRTSDPDAAGAFYADLLGHCGDAIEVLPPTAAARGAPPHWLGVIDVAAIGGSEAVAERFVARGATRLASMPGRVVLRDPGGAVFALGAAPGPSRANVALHLLHAPDAVSAAALYTELLGWSLTERLALGSHSQLQQFAWRAGEPNAGAIAAIDQPSVHPQWLFCFRVSELDRKLALVRERGGLVLGPMQLPDGARLAACDDPQGAAFGLLEPSRHPNGS
jgi:predicted enzyme related to lactoylglutathione lyase